MKGLLIKDLHILLRQKTTLLIIALIGIFMSVNGGNASFSLGYMMVVSTMMVITTISYDYFEKGMSFMFTLPIQRKEYVLEKYVLALLIEVLVAIFASLIQVGGMLFGASADWKVFLITGASCLVVAMLVLAVYIPVYIKCGPEKSRIAMFIVVGIVMAITYLVAKVKTVQELLIALAEAISKMTTVQIAGIGITVFVLIMVGSVGMSMAIMEKKEF